MNYGSNSSFYAWGHLDFGKPVRRIKVILTFFINYSKITCKVSRLRFDDAINLPKMQRDSIPFILDAHREKGIAPPNRGFPRRTVS